MSTSVAGPNLTVHADLRRTAPQLLYFPVTAEIATQFYENSDLDSFTDAVADFLSVWGDVELQDIQNEDAFVELIGLLERKKSLLEPFKKLVQMVSTEFKRQARDIVEETSDIIIDGKRAQSIKPNVEKDELFAKANAVNNLVASLPLPQVFERAVIYCAYQIQLMHDHLNSFKNIQYNAFTKLRLPYSPTDVAKALAYYKIDTSKLLILGVDNRIKRETFKN